METNLKLQNKTAVIGGGADSMMVEIVQYQDSDRRAGSASFPLAFHKI